MINNFNFSIENKGNISSHFLKNNIADFQQAMNYIRQLSYARNKNKNDLTTLFTDNCGTCSTKHALLKALAIENGQPGVKLMLGLFKMRRSYAVRVGDVLSKYKLDHIPEAHNYLRIHDEIVDCTTMNPSANSFINELISEIEIEPMQITDFKVNYHKQYLREWLVSQPGIAISFDELWKIREECIATLSE